MISRSKWRLVSNFDSLDLLLVSLSWSQRQRPLTVLAWFSSAWLLREYKIWYIQKYWGETYLFQYYNETGSWGQGIWNSNIGWSKSKPSCLEECEQRPIEERVDYTMGGTAVALGPPDEKVVGNGNGGTEHAQPSTEDNWELPKNIDQEIKS